MASIPVVTLMAVFVAVSAATLARNDPIREHPHSVVVTEGEWANFTCGIKLPGMIRWRIGDLQWDGDAYYTGGNLREVEGVTAQIPSSEVNGSILYETIQVLATVELDGAPVQCKFDTGNNNRKKDSFSMFSLIHVNTLGTFSSGEIY